MGRVKQDGTRTPYWECQRRAEERYVCEDSRFIRERLLQEMFVELYNKLNEERTTSNIKLLSAQLREWWGK